MSRWSMMVYPNVIETLVKQPSFLGFHCFLVEPNFSRSKHHENGCSWLVCEQALQLTESIPWWHALIIHPTIRPFQGSISVFAYCKKL